MSVIARIYQTAVKICVSHKRHDGLRQVSVMKLSKKLLAQWRCMEITRRKGQQSVNMLCWTCYERYRGWGQAKEVI